MCRYAEYGPYKQKWACFQCRKSFKKTSRSQSGPLLSAAEARARLMLCPQCCTPMHNMGLDFKAPRQNDIEQWRKVELLLAHGYRYSSCGCNGPGERPARLKEVPAFLEAQQQKADWWRWSSEVQQRAATLKTRRKKKRQLLEMKRFEKRTQRETASLSCAS